MFFLKFVTKKAEIFIKKNWSQFFSYNFGNVSFNKTKQKSTEIIINLVLILTIQNLIFNPILC